MEVVFKLLRHVTILVQMKLTLGRKRVEWPTSHRAHRLTLTRLVCSARLFDKPSTRFCHRQRKWSGVSNLSSLLHLCSTGPSIEFTFIYDWMWALSSRHAVSSFKKEFRWVYKRFHQLILYLLVPRMKFHGQKKNHKLSPNNQIWAFTHCCQLCYEWRRSYTQAALGNAFSSGYVQWGVCADVHFKRPRLKLSGSQVATQVFITLFGLYVQNGRPLIRNQVKLDQSQTFIYIALFTGKKIL